MYVKTSEEAAAGGKELTIVLTVAQAEALECIPTPNADGLDACWSEEDFVLGMYKIRDALKFYYRVGRYSPKQSKGEK